MNKKERIQKINKALEEYFENSNNPRIVRAKELVGLFIERGAFGQNARDGLPLRKFLRMLRDEKKLSAIPYVKADKKGTNTNWFFIAPLTSNVTSNSIMETTKPKSASASKSKNRRSDSDEYYVIGLCNELLGLVASQQHRFDFLVGDAGTKLPVDAYYEEINLVVEYCESQHTCPTPLFDNKETASGVSRGEQRRIYDERRRIELPKHGINIVTIHHSDFGTTKKIKRNHNHDIDVVRKKLSDYIKG